MKYRILAFNINESYEYAQENYLLNMSKTSKKIYNDFIVYECARSCWVIDIKRARKCDFAVAVYNGKIVGVYEVVGWFHGGETSKFFKPKRPIKKSRYEFVGKIIRKSSFLGKEVLFKQGENNPIKYTFFENGKEIDSEEWKE